MGVGGERARGGMDAQQLEAVLAQVPAALNVEQRLAIERMLCVSHRRQGALLFAARYQQFAHAR